MFSSSEIFSRIKDVTRRHALDQQGVVDPLWKQWILLVAFCTLVLVAVVVFAIGRYVYWSSIETRLFAEKQTVSTFDIRAIDSILEEYTAKAERAQLILEMTDRVDPPDLNDTESID